jgi:Uma2 family endonuclease
MTQAIEKRRHTVPEYLRMEREALDKHEFHDGEILAMSGGTVAHSLIAAKVSRELGLRLKDNPCRVYDSSLRVCINRVGKYVYPDTTIICGPVQIDPNDPFGETAINPRVIVEVLSPSTESYDRKGKFDGYRTIDSFEEYVLVYQTAPRVEVFLRQADGSWALTVFEGLQTVAQIRSIRIGLPLSEAYAGVEFPPPEPEPAPRRR